MLDVKSLKCPQHGHVLYTKCTQLVYVYYNIYTFVTLVPMPCLNSTIFMNVVLL